MTNNIYNNLLSDSILTQDSDNSDNLNDESSWTVIPKKKKKKKTLHIKNNYKKDYNKSYIKIDNLINSKKNKNNKKENHKKILCKNIISNKVCKYGDKCLYAHSLEEQKLELLRERAYDLIKGKISGENINIYLEKDLYKTLLTLCDLCNKCHNNNCTGGYNCKHGTCRKEFIVCGNNLYNGKCNGKCGKIHLTNNGLKPYFTYILESQKYKKNYNNFKKITIGTLLTNNFFKQNINQSNYLSDISSDSESDNETDVNFNTSIFKVPIT
jgi:hypothetical protein